MTRCCCVSDSTSDGCANPLRTRCFRLLAAVWKWRSLQRRSGSGPVESVAKWLRSLEVSRVGSWPAAALVGNGKFSPLSEATALQPARGVCVTCLPTLRFASCRLVEVAEPSAVAFSRPHSSRQYSVWANYAPTVRIAAIVRNAITAVNRCHFARLVEKCHPIGESHAPSALH